MLFQRREYVDIMKIKDTIELSKKLLLLLILFELLLLFGTFNGIFSYFEQSPSNVITSGDCVLIVGNAGTKELCK